jgi:hypothetical protein
MASDQYYQGQNPQTVRRREFELALNLPVNWCFLERPTCRNGCRPAMRIPVDAPHQFAEAFGTRRVAARREIVFHSRRRKISQDCMTLVRYDRGKGERLWSNQTF